MATPKGFPSHKLPFGLEQNGPLLTFPSWLRFTLLFPRSHWEHSASPKIARGPPEQTLTPQSSQLNASLGKQVWHADCDWSGSVGRDCQRKHGDNRGLYFFFLYHYYHYYFYFIYFILAETRQHQALPQSAMPNNRLENFMSNGGGAITELLSRMSAIKLMGPPPIRGTWGFWTKRLWDIFGPQWANLTGLTSSAGDSMTVTVCWTGVMIILSCVSNTAKRCIFL